MLFIRKVFLIVLYLTPFGYLIDAIKLLSGKITFGIYIKLGTSTPFTANIKKKFTSRDRLNWFGQGLFLISQAIYIYSRHEISDLAGAYGLLSLIFGSVGLISGVFPKIAWNRKVL